MISDEELKELEKLRQKTGDETNIEELRWKIETHVKDFDELKNNIYKLEPWDLLYEPYELYTDNRKRN